MKTDDIMSLKEKKESLFLFFSFSRITLRLQSLNSKSKLEKSVRELVMLLFDVDEMKRTLTDMEFDLDKMPLGYLSRNQGV